MCRIQLWSWLAREGFLEVTFKISENKELYRQLEESVSSREDC
jgi:hypothetical protein